MAECDNSLTTMDWLSAVDVQIAPAKNELLESSLSLTNPSSTKDPFEDFRPLERETGKPSHSYSTLIKLAILSTRSKRMSLRQIYKWISDTFPYYKDARNGWKNSIRHNLSLNKCFIKVPRDKGDMGKGCYWSLREGFRPESTPAGAGMRMPTITVTSTGGATPQHPVFGTAGVNCGSGSSGNASFINQTPLPPPPAGVSQPGQDGIPDLTDSTVGALAALMGSQSDQVLGAALAPSVTGAQAHQQLPGSSTMMQLPSQPDPSPCLTPPPPPSLSPPSAGAADQLSLSASLQTICRSLLGESSSGGSSGGVGIGAFASVETGGGSSGGSSSGEGASCQAPDLSASTLDFVQRMLPQLKDSFQLSDSALHDLWDHCRSTSRPSAVPESGHHQDGSPNAGTFNGVIQLPTAVEVQRQQQNARLPAQLQSRTQQQPPPPPPPRWGQQPQPAQSQSHRPAHDSGQEVEDEFNWDSIL